MNRGIKLMPDYGCWPLWHHGGAEIGDIDPRKLGLSTELLRALKSWASVYDSHLNMNYPASTAWTKDEEREFDSEGKRLARELASELGAQFQVFYSARCIPVEALIDTNS
jgi:hypothetical protein